MIVLQEKRRPTFGERFAEGLVEGGKKGMDYAAQLGIEREKAPGRRKEEDLAIKESGRDSIARMRDIIKRGKTGWNVANYLTAEGRADRAAMDTAALNLERLAVEMQGKGVLSKPRFEYMVKRLPSSFKSDAENNAVLDEWENILGGSGRQEDIEEKNKKKEKYNPKNKKHRAKAEQLFETYKDKEKVREILSREFEGV